MLKNMLKVYNKLMLAKSFFSVWIHLKENDLFVKLQMDESAGIEAEYHHKNNRVCLRISRLSHISK